MLSQQLRDCGVVGAGGAGFPTYVKSQAEVEYLIANGAECEPLIHKDAELMEHFPAEILAGFAAMMEATHARAGRFGIKSKNAAALEAIRARLPVDRVDLTLLGDFYPSGDEYELVYAATGRLIPPAGIPLQVGCVVSNVETLRNVHLATRGIPVVDKLLSIAGAVREPKSFWAPIGTSFRDLLELAGGASVADFGMFVSGIMMGTLSFDLDDVVTKTTAGLIVLPRDHYLITRRERPLESMNRIGKSACDQCTYCTEFCPRYLLGYEVVPHKVMRSLGFTLTGADNWNQWAELCCSCGLCTLYACPEDLYPREACDQGKADRRAAGMKFVQQKSVTVHPMKEYRRVPQSQLRKRLHVEEYDRPTPFTAVGVHPKVVRIKLLQHAGKPAHPAVEVGARVRRGQLIGRAEPSALSVPIHASMDGRVGAITEQYIQISA